MTMIYDFDELRLKQFEQFKVYLARKSASLSDTERCKLLLTSANDHIVKFLIEGFLIKTIDYPKPQGLKEHYVHLWNSMKLARAKEIIKHHYPFFENSLAKLVAKDSLLELSILALARSLSND